MSNYPINGVGLKGKLTTPLIPQLGASASKASNLEFVSIMSGKQENWFLFLKLKKLQFPKIFILFEILCFLEMGAKCWHIGFDPVSQT